MRHLIAKDVGLAAPYLWLIIPVHVLWCAQAFLVPELYFWMSLMPAIVWTVGVLAAEWQMDTDRFAASLPVTRATIVRARYASALGGLALGATLFVVYGHAIAAVASGRAARYYPSPSWASVDGVTAFVLVGFVLLVAFLPFYFRFGLPYGASCFAVSATVILLVAAALARFGDSGWAAGGSPSTIVRGWLVALAAAWGVLVATPALLAGAIGLGSVSMWLSVRFYEEREL
jgi:hypothetical protein